MVWDIAVIYLGLSLAVTGWNIGIKNSWPTPFGVALATVMTQFLYVNVSMWILDQSRLPGELSYFIGYATVWILLDTVIEVFLTKVFPLNRQPSINRLNRAAGAAVGAFKACIIVLFATAASVASILAPVPLDSPAIAQWLAQGSGESILLKMGRKAASGLPSVVACRIISDEQPSYHANFEDNSVVKVDQERVDRYRTLFNTLKTLQQL